MALTNAQKLEKIQQQIAELHAKDKALKGRMASHIVQLLHQENAFALEPSLLYGGVLDTLSRLHKIDEKDPERMRLQALGSTWLKKKKKRT